MSCRPQKLAEMEVEVFDAPVSVTGVIFYPSLPEYRGDPPEAAFVEWASVFIGGVDVSEMFSIKSLSEKLSDVLIQRLEPM